MPATQAPTLRVLTLNLHKGFSALKRREVPSGILHCAIDVPGVGPVNAFCVHLGLREWHRQIQIDALRTLVPVLPRLERRAWLRWRPAPFKRRAAVPQPPADTEGARVAILKHRIAQREPVGQVEVADHRKRPGLGHGGS